MTLNEVRGGQRIFVDANILICHFTGRSQECSKLLSRIEAGEITGATGPTVVLEVAHRLMIIEAIERGLKEGSNPAARLGRDPAVVARLSKYYFETARIQEMGVEMLTLPQDFLARSQEYRQMHGLLVNDSLIAMYMRDAGLSLLASADSAFDRVPWITRVGAGDL